MICWSDKLVRFQLDLELASGEYFLKPKEKENIQKRKQLDKVCRSFLPPLCWSRADQPLDNQQHAVTDERRAQREEAFIAPPERVAPTLQEKAEKKKKRKREAGEE